MNAACESWRLFLKSSRTHISKILSTEYKHIPSQQASEWLQRVRQVDVSGMRARHFASWFTFNIPCLFFSWRTTRTPNHSSLVRDAFNPSQQCFLRVSLDIESRHWWNEFGPTRFRVVAAVTSKSKVATSKSTPWICYYLRCFAQPHIKWFGWDTPLVIQSKLVGHLGASSGSVFWRELSAKINENDVFE
jgi:hypothetical protein